MLRILLLTFMVLPWSAPAVAQEADSFEDPVLPLAAKTQRTDEQSLRLISRAWYGEARLQLRREDYAGALTGYQRAWRYNPEADAILPRIVLLVRQLRRPEVAGRYLAHVKDLLRINPALLRQLGLQLSARGQWDTAIRPFEHTLPPASRDRGPDARRSGNAVAASGTGPFAFSHKEPRAIRRFLLRSYGGPSTDPSCWNRIPHSSRHS